MRPLRRGLRVIQGRMRTGSMRRGVVATLLASFLSLFVLVSTVEAGACLAREAGASVMVATVPELAAPAGQDDAGRDAADPRGCTHCQCHHGGVAAAPAAPDVGRTVNASAPHRPLRVDHRPSRMPTGPERPPRA